MPFFFLNKYDLERKCLKIEAIDGYTILCEYVGYKAVGPWEAGTKHCDQDHWSEF